MTIVDAAEVAMERAVYAFQLERLYATQCATHQESPLPIATVAKFDAPLSMEAFLAEPTIGRMGCHLRVRSRKLNEQPVVPLQPHVKAVAKEFLAAIAEAQVS